MKKKIMSLLLAFVMVFTIAQPAMAYAQVGYGSRSQDVKTMQTMLNEVLNTTLSVDGIFGSASLAAVKSFQRSRGLSPDGICGPKTWAALEADYKKLNSPKPTPAPAPTTSHKEVGMGAQGQEVKTLQSYLTKLGIANLNADGIFGAKTKNAVITFQQRHGLAADGICGKQTWAKLESLINPSNPAPTPAASTLQISSGSYAPGNLKFGQAYSINGSISSNYSITEVVVGIYDANGQTIMEAKETPNSYNYNIYAVDRQMRFGSLASGSYRFKVNARDSSMSSSRTLVNNQFTVGSAPVTGPYEKMAKATHEVQGKKMCVLTSFSMLVKHKLYVEGKSYSAMNQNIIKGYNGSVVDASWGKICANINANAGTNGTIAIKVNRCDYSGAENVAHLKKLLAQRPEGVLVHCAGKSGAHAVLFCNYDEQRGSFMVSDPGRAENKYVALEDSLLAAPWYGFGRTAESILSHINAIAYYN